MKKTLLRVNLTLFTLALCATFGQVAPSFADGACRSLFQESSFSEVLGKWEGQMEFELMVGASRPTVKASYSESNPNFVILSRDKSDFWLSNASSLAGKQDRQGSPVFNFMAFGKNISDALNFRIIDEYTVEVPIAQEMNRGIFKLSAELQKAGREPIPFHFYNQSSLKLRPYIDSFKRSFGLPLADPKESRVHFVHDASYHYSTILLPPVYIRALHQKVGLVLEVIRYLESLEPTPLIKRYIKKMESDVTNRIDAGTANMGILYTFGTKESTKALYQESQAALLSAIFTYRVGFTVTSLTGKKFRHEKEQETLDEKIANLLDQPAMIERYPLILKTTERTALNTPEALEKAMAQRKQEIEEAAIVILKDYQD